ncbi:MAG TPA: Asp-tRNA(Asn)/Glu-tRNA(Gln) amidotransferase subunit GatC [Desulfomicrobiaceae bacterium]|jgi:aspartyl-tRNA(Asn)/glutamyl-tRNA(Gln) amidotransferase subunit C|nr:Asp-tRNA(Asn)/Glu-tRNA(Gln) amidotransferase subunit GatC [Desulfomicrobiaceae bacterium]
MRITPEEVARIADLARLDMDAEQSLRLAAQMDDILGYMEKLGELDTADVPPMYTPVEHTTPLREDTVRSECTREQILANAPEEDGKYFIVPRIV